MTLKPKLSDIWAVPACASSLGMQLWGYTQGAQDVRLPSCRMGSQPVALVAGWLLMSGMCSRSSAQRGSCTWAGRAEAAWGSAALPSPWDGQARPSPNSSLSYQLQPGSQEEEGKATCLLLHLSFFNLTWNKGVDQGF